MWSYIYIYIVRKIKTRRLAWLGYTERKPKRIIGWKPIANRPKER